jgi:hypothetical protein
MIKILSRLLIVLALCSCYHTAPDPSFNKNLIIPADSMVTLLTDLHLADGVVTTIKLKDKTSLGHLSTEYFAVIMKKHKIGKDTFEESLRYYAYHTEEMNKIYEKVIVNLSKTESMATSK